MEYAYLAHGICIPCIWNMHSLHMKYAYLAYAYLHMEYAYLAYAYLHMEYAYFALECAYFAFIDANGYSYFYTN